MTPTCSIGKALREQWESHSPDAMTPSWRECEGPLSPLMVVSEDALVAKYPHGAVVAPGGCRPVESASEWRFLTTKAAPLDRSKFLSLDQLRELLTVGGPCPRCIAQGVHCPEGKGCHGTGRDTYGCEKHMAMVRPRRFVRGINAACYAFLGAAPAEWVETEPPALRLTDLLREECPQLYKVGARCHTRTCRCSEPCRTCNRTGTIPHPALTEAMEWAERLGLDQDGPDHRHDRREAAS